jgi:signal recognition particle subunit SEC65
VHGGVVLSVVLELLVLFFQSLSRKAGRKVQKKKVQNTKAKDVRHF